jgi:hypothetical protein
MAVQILLSTIYHRHTKAHDSLGSFSTESRWQIAIYFLKIRLLLLLRLNLDHMQYLLSGLSSHITTLFTRLLTSVTLFDPDPNLQVQ